MDIFASRALAAYCVSVALLFGAVMGSFLNCAAWRIARGESFVRGRSRCPACSHTLGPADLVPVLSWVFSRGRCRYCGAPVSVRYPVTELLCAALTVSCLLRFGLSALCARNYVFVCCLFCLSLVDLDVCEIPDGCLLISAAAWFAALPFLRVGARAALGNVLAGLCTGAALLLMSMAMDRALGRESMGGGDIKLFAVVGLYLGATATLFALLLSCVLGLVFAAATGAGRSRPFPFGPSVAAAACVLLFGGDALTAWYWNLF